MLLLVSSAFVAFHVAGDPIPFLLPGRIHVHVRLAVAVVVILVHVVGEELCVFIGVPTIKSTSTSCDVMQVYCLMIPAVAPALLPCGLRGGPEGGAADVLHFVERILFCVALWEI